VRVRTFLWARTRASTTMLSEDWKMCARTHICAHDILRACAHIFRSTRARKHTNAFGLLENVFARTNICAHDLVRAHGSFFRSTRARASPTMLRNIGQCVREHAHQCFRMIGQAHICAHHLLRACARIFRRTRLRVSTPMLSEEWKMCVCAQCFRMNG
jgi:hypothetical protein